MQPLFDIKIIPFFIVFTLSKWRINKQRAIAPQNRKKNQEAKPPNFSSSTTLRLVIFKSFIKNYALGFLMINFASLSFSDKYPPPTPDFQLDSVDDW